MCCHVVVPILLHQLRENLEGWSSFCPHLLEAAVNQGVLPSALKFPDWKLTSPGLHSSKNPVLLASYRGRWRTSCGHDPLSVWRGWEQDLGVLCRARSVHTAETERSFATQ